jgi:hypothetical protein
MHQIKRITIHIEYLFTIYNSKLWQRKTTPPLLLTQHLLGVVVAKTCYVQSVSDDIL